MTDGSDVGTLSGPNTTYTAKPHPIPQQDDAMLTAHCQNRAVSSCCTPHPVETPELGRTIIHTKPTPPSNGLAHIEIGSAPKPVRGRASPGPKPMMPPPSPQPFGAEATKHQPTSSCPAKPRSPIPILVDQNRIRRFSIKVQQKLDRSIESLLTQFLGYKHTNDEEGRKEVFRHARKIRLAVERTGSLPSEFIISPGMEMQLLQVIITNANSRVAYDKYREDAEAKMAILAAELPEHEWQKGINGFGDRGLAILAAEAAGEKYLRFGEYKTVGGLWKRMGLAVIDGERQRKVGGIRASPEERKKLAYVPERRAACWVLSESLLKAQMCSELRACREAIAASQSAMAACAERGIDVKAEKKAERLQAVIAELGLSAEGHATGPYGEVYLLRKRHTFPRIEATQDLPKALKWTRSRCHSDAMRVMFKTLLKDLWAESRKLYEAETDR
jgi:hypothetical protein